jgi:hypothetical protein
MCIGGSSIPSPRTRKNSEESADRNSDRRGTSHLPWSEFTLVSGPYRRPASWVDKRFSSAGPNPHATCSSSRTCLPGMGRSKFNRLCRRLAKLSSRLGSGQPGPAHRRTRSADGIPPLDPFDIGMPGPHSIQHEYSADIPPAVAARGAARRRRVAPNPEGESLGLRGTLSTLRRDLLPIADH